MENIASENHGINYSNKHFQYDDSDLMDSLQAEMDYLIKLTDQSQQLIDENERVTNETEQLNNELITTERQIYQWSTKLNNFDIFDQHLTSLNMRCEFLDQQVGKLESRADNLQKIGRGIKAEVNLGLSEFSRFGDTGGMDWKTTETTLENLKKEFIYLSDQLKEANSFDDELSFEQDANSSLFSDQNSGSDFTNFSDRSLNDCIDLGNTNQPKKKLMKMESFLNIQDQPIKAIPSPSDDLEDFLIRPLKLARKQMPDVSKELSSNNGNGKLNCTSLISPTVNVNHTEKKKYKPAIAISPIIEETSSSIFQQHKRSSSFPASSITAVTYEEEGEEDDSLRHYLSYDTALNNKFVNDLDRLFDKKNNRVLGSISLPATKSRGSKKSRHKAPPPIPEYGECHLDFQNSSMLNADSFYGNDHSDTESDGSYGNEDAEPFELPSKSKLHRSNSHESIFSNKLNFTAQEQLAETYLNYNKDKTTSQKNNTDSAQCKQDNFKYEGTIDLKQQTMKWLTPTHACAEVQIGEATFLSSSNGENVKRIYEGVGRSRSSSQSSATCKSREIITPITIKRKLKHSRSISASSILMPNTSSEHEESTMGASWFNFPAFSMIPNSAFTSPETGKIVGRVSGRSLFNGTPPNYIRRNGYERKFPGHSLGMNSSKARPETLKYQQSRNPNSNNLASSATIIFEKNYVIKHGNSDVNGSVVSSRISHGALREALECDISR